MTENLSTKNFQPENSVLTIHFGEERLDFPLNKLGCKDFEEFLKTMENLYRFKKDFISYIKWIQEQADTSTQDDYDPEVILKNITRDCEEALRKLENVNNIDSTGSLHCNRCGKNVFINPKDYFMLKDEIWKEACNNKYWSLDSVLCKQCTEDLLERELQDTDYTDAPVNSFLKEK